MGNVKENILVLFGAASNLEWGRSYQLAKAFCANGHNVLYVDLPTPLSEFLALKKRQPGPNIDSLDIYQPQWGLPYGRIKLLRPLNRKNICIQLYHYLKKKKFAPTILWIYSPYDPEIAKQLIYDFKIKRVVYDCADDRIAYATISCGRKGAEVVSAFEEELSRVSNVVFCISLQLKDRLINYNSNCYMLPNGVDTELFDYEKAYTKPRFISDTNDKIVLYIGTIGDWVDTDLIREVAMYYTDVKFVFVGPSEVDVSNIASLDNCIFVGKQPYITMPSYIAHADLCIIPFRNNDVTKACDTLKLLQYLVMRKPIISTYYEGIRDYKGLIHIAHNKNEFIGAVGKVLYSDVIPDIGALQEVTHKMSWKNVASRAIDILTAV